jgi:hypothetical protein
MPLCNQPGDGTSKEKRQIVGVWLYNKIAHVFDSPFILLNAEVSPFGRMNSALRR